MNNTERNAAILLESMLNWSEKDRPLLPDYIWYAMEFLNYSIRSGGGQIPHAEFTAEIPPTYHLEAEKITKILRTEFEKL